MGIGFLAAAIILGMFILFDQILNYTWYNPAFIVPLYGWMDRHGLTFWIPSYQTPASVPTDKGYALTTIHKINAGLYALPHAAVEGVVSAVVRSPDGDWHVNIADDRGGTLVAEIVPEYPLVPPPVGSRVKLWGLTRYDIEHRWWEIHPVFGWQTPRAL